MILANIADWKRYAGLGEGIARGLELLAGGTLDGLSEGRHDLDGERLYATVQLYRPKAPAEGRWEAHRKYVDLQYLVSGSEAIGCCAIEKLREVEAYSESRDVVFFDRGPEVGTVLKVEAKMFAIFFPADAHMPMLSLEALPLPAITAAARPPALVKKIVLKVRV